MRHPMPVEMEKLLYTVLAQVGLAAPEIRLYVLSFTLGPSKISTLSTKSGISRPTAYTLIDRLIEVGLANGRRGNGVRDFWVKSPMQALSMLKGKNSAGRQLQEDLLSSMPSLLSLYHRTKNPPKMQVVEGQDALVVLRDQILEEERTEILFCGSAKDYIGMLPSGAREPWIRRRVRLGVKARVLVPEGKMLKDDDGKELREVRVLKNVPTFPTTFQIFGNKIVLWQPLAFYAIVIEDAYFVDMMRSTFYGLWAGSAVPEART